jgi:CO/xanthine dehydrogenase FAD-binding subunit
MMIIEYHRPETIDEALALLSRKDPPTVPLSGGLYINEVVKSQIAVVDIQALGLNKIQKKGKNLILGAGSTLQTISENGNTPRALLEAIKYQETYNRRQIASIVGTLIAVTGRSAIPAVMLAMDAVIELVGGKDKTTKLPLGELLPLREDNLLGRLMTSVTIPLGIESRFEYVARSPADLPIVAAAVSQWPAGRTRVVLAGYGDQPVMVFDGPDSEGAEIAARDAYSKSDDQWATGEYRAETAAVLVQRCIEDITEKKEG